MVKIGVLGAGTWGIALARLLANKKVLNTYGSKKKINVTVWSAIEAEIEELVTTNTYNRMPKVVLPNNIRYTTIIEEACRDKDVILVAVPSTFVRDTIRIAKKYISYNSVIVNVAKGIEEETLLTMTEVITEELQTDRECKDVKIATLAGPTHAEEVAMDLPTTIVSASSELTIAEYIQELFMTAYMRVYTNTDVKGIEICGSLKNIIALASGVSSGLNYGDNARAALITRGIAEISRLVEATDCNLQTISGLAGIGDLVVTCTSTHSRNYRTGYLIGRGDKPQEAMKKVGMVVEGINAIPAAIKLAKRYNLKMPIIESMDLIINHGVNVKIAADRLMKRDKKSEY